MQRRVDWAGEVMNVIEPERRKRVGKDKLQDRQVWRDKRLMALAAHKKRAAKEIGN
jgi:L-gulonate 3-dehydrogenase